MTKLRRNTMLVTGACGGIGRCAIRRAGASSNLLLTDVAEGALDAFAQTLRDEGFSVVRTVAGDLADSAVLSRLSESIADNDGLDRLIHTAGLSPAQAGWNAILGVNILATQRLVAMVEPVLNPGAAAVMVASMAGHVGPDTPEVQNVLDGSLDDQKLEDVGRLLVSMSQGKVEIAAQLAYMFSKRAVIQLAEQRAPAWGARGARIMTISPGLIYTPMGLKEADCDPRIKAMIEAQPIGRWGTANDIADAIAFLLGPSASFITGCDLRIDGGATALNRTSSTDTSIAELDA